MFLRGGGGGGGEGGSKISECFFTRNPNLKFGGGGGGGTGRAGVREGLVCVWGGGGAGVSKFFYNESK